MAISFLKAQVPCQMQLSCHWIQNGDSLQSHSGLLLIEYYTVWVQFRRSREIQGLSEFTQGLAEQHATRQNRRTAQHDFA